MSYNGQTRQPITLYDKNPRCIPYPSLLILVDLQLLEKYFKKERELTRNALSIAYKSGTYKMRFGA